MNQDNENELLPIAAAVKEVSGKNFHVVTIRRWRREGRLTGCVRIGREWFCRRADVLAMIERETASTKQSQSVA